jgi:hypothetical protein
MKTIELLSLGTTQPTSAYHSVVMKNKDVRKIQFGGWNKRRYKEIRRKILKMVFKETE